MLTFRPPASAFNGLLISLIIENENITQSTNWLGLTSGVFAGLSWYAEISRNLHQKTLEELQCHSIEHTEALHGSVRRSWSADKLI